VEPTLLTLSRPPPPHSRADSDPSRHRTEYW
jgi:hypothetical protein